MNDTDFETQKKRVLDCFDRWKTDLGLSDWHVSLEWYREAKAATAAGQSDTAMDVQTQWVYQSAIVSVYLPTAMHIKDERLDWYVLHEMMHMLVAEMARKDKPRDKREEHVCSQLATAFIRLSDSATDQGREVGRNERPTGVTMNEPPTIERTNGHAPMPVPALVV